jgi:hypothetical protein
MAMEPHALEGPKRGPMLSRWSAVLSGAAVAFGTFFSLMLLWIYLATYQSFFGRDLQWFALGSALFAALACGYVAGYVEDWRGAGVGMWNGITAWCVVLTLTTLVALPIFLNALGPGTPAQRFRALDSATMLTFFVSYLGGIILAGLAASYGAAARRPDSLFRITPEAERQFLTDLSRPRVTHPYTEVHVEQI